MSNTVTNGETIGDGDVGVVKISDFLEFLNISFQVTDAITNKNPVKSSNQLDFDQLQHNELISNLLARSNAANRTSPTSSIDGKSKTKPEEDKGDKKQKKRSINKSKSKFNSFGDRLDPALQHKLDEVINEGILDSVLPFVCPNVGTNQDCNGHNVVLNTGTKPKPTQLLPKASNINNQVEIQGDHIGNNTSHASKKGHKSPEKQISVTHPPKNTRKKSSSNNSIGFVEKNGE